MSQDIADPVALLAAYVQIFNLPEALSRPIQRKERGEDVKFPRVSLTLGIAMDTAMGQEQRQIETSTGFPWHRRLRLALIRSTLNITLSPID